MFLTMVCNIPGISKWGVGYPRYILGYPIPGTYRGICVLSPALARVTPIKPVRFHGLVIFMSTAMLHTIAKLLNNRAHSPMSQDSLLIYRVVGLVPKSLKMPVPVQA